MNEHICTLDSPWQLGMDRAIHPDAEIVHSTCDCCERYYCPNCTLIFKEHLPE